MNAKMAGPLKCVIVLSFFVSVFAKELHFKQTLEAKDRAVKGFMNIFNHQDILKNDRFARHVKTTTESVLDHLIDEIKHQYFRGSYNKNSPIPRLIKNLNKELLRNERMKLQKEKDKRKNANKKKVNTKTTIKSKPKTTKPTKKSTTPSTKKIEVKNINNKLTRVK